MNPLLIFWLSIGGLMALAGGGGSATSTTSANATRPDDNDTSSGSNTDSSNNNNNGPADTPNAPTIADDAPTPPEQSGDGGPGAGTVPLEVDGRVTLYAGRSHTLEAPEDAVSVKLVSNVNHGNVTVNPDNSFAVVLTKTDWTGNQSFTYEVTKADGSTSTEQVDLRLIEGLQDQGWATGESHYMLATDENDNVIVESGEIHTKVHISGSNDALSRADIAALEGVSVNQVTGEWLAEIGGYGETPEMALDTEMGMQLWYAVTPRDSTSSNHLLFERGYEYSPSRILMRDTHGEDPLHPLHVGSYGEGLRPQILTRFEQNSEGSTNVVVQGLDFHDGLEFKTNGENIMVDNVKVQGGEMVMMKLDGVTVRNSLVADVHLEDAANGNTWSGGDKIAGAFSNFNDGVLFENVVFDLNGWEEGYNRNTFDADDPQAPSKYNHNLYIGDDNTDVTVRDLISMRGSSHGMQLRTGGFLEDAFFAENNIGFNSLGGDYKGQGNIDNYSLLTDFVVTAPAYRASFDIGGRPNGFDDRGELSSLVDGIVTHLADPNNPDQLAERPITDDPQTQIDTPYYDDTIIWNWKGNEPTKRVTEKNAEDLDHDVLNDTTFQNFIATLLGDDDAYVQEFGDFLRQQFDAEGEQVVDADFILRYFQEGFGIASDIRTDAETLRFVPNDLAEGVRWDNRLNWTTEDLPGTVDGDSVDLGGNHVVYGLNTTLDTLKFGESGELSVYGGRLTLDNGIIDDETAALEIRHAGQLWTDGSKNDLLDIDVTGGRFLNSGDMAGANLSATGGETVLATGGAIYGVAEGDTLKTTGDVKIGFDDDDGGVALLALEDGSTLHFEAANGALSTIEEFRTGAFGDSPDVRSGIDLGNSTLKIDLAGLNAANGEALKLLDADEIIGAFDNADISGLGGRNATITIDYVNDSVSMTLSNGSGNVSFQTIGQNDDVSQGEQALWNLLTSGQGVFDENMPDIPDDEMEYLEAV